MIPESGKTSYVSSNVQTTTAALTNQLQENFLCMKERERNEISKKGAIPHARESNLDAEMENSSVQKKLSFKEVISPHVNNLLPWYGSVCLRSCFCAQGEID